MSAEELAVNDSPQDEDPQEDNTQELQAVSQLRDQYISLHDSLDDLLDACQNDAQKRQVGDAVQTALKNYIDAQNHIFGRSADLIAAVIDAASNAQDAIDKALQKLENIKQTLNTITTVVNDVATVVAALA